MVGCGGSAIKAWEHRRRYYRLEGHEVVQLADAEEWMAWFALHGNDRHVGCDHVRGCVVSTNFLGLAPNPEGDPLIFETAVFEGREVTDQQRWTSWEHAEAGHAAIVAGIATRAL